MAGAQSWYRDTETGQYVFDAFVLIYAPVDVCFADWSNFETFPKLLSHITGVKRIGENRWHWEAQIGGQHAAWEAMVSEFQPNEAISWVSISGVKNSGSIYFSSEDRGTRVAVHLMYDPPYGFIGDLIAERRINDEFQRDLQHDLANFKHSVESGTAEDYRRAA